MGTTPSMDWATPMRPALVPARTTQRVGPRKSDPPHPAPHSPQTAPPKKGSTPTAPPPPTRLTHWQPTRRRPVPGNAKQPRPSTRQGGTRGATLRAVAGAWAGTYKPTPRSRRGSGPGDQRGTVGNPDASPPLPPPPQPAGCSRHAKEAPALYPPCRARGGPPPPQVGCGTRGKAPLGPYATRPETTTRPLRR